MITKALGLIETIGLAAAIEACDTALKSADITLIGYELSKGGGMVTVKIQGDVGAVKAAVEAAKIAASKVNKVYTSVVIPRPIEGIKDMVVSAETVGVAKQQYDVDNSDNNLNSTDNVIKISKLKEIKANKDGNKTNKAEEAEEEKDEEDEVEEIGEVMIEIENKDETKLDEIANTKDVCNLCKDPLCPRRKGQPRNLCIHYKK
ncbi:BMC domain-containing protein [Thermoanaerobacterium sp. RBIITD]|uniref:BMC domain-containing protein n=1 Tax=Thermoanaerobacterium sp. RBIITD TaxID=1550240 RepID=UPI000BC06005|nr:BMC domain-containing protein [Thermoanaerobacterium sp. RBIITD]SNX54722.1 BMC domain-containing protein [Thermoanaerobacterium sp. RBIITD]